MYRRAFTGFLKPIVDLAAMSNPIRPVVISGPSGGGKSTILNKATKEFPEAFAFSVSHTTRKPREGEEHGTHYFFTDKEEMKRMIGNNEFLEHAEFGGNIYGTSLRAVEDVQKTGKICVLDIELQGVRNIKNTSLDAKYILIRAPSIAVLVR
uniref:Guanylate kinase-like domain-containing protein n=1 Tax=Steinernema glaseri TaxID=37863 RepID=A0A1I7YUA2_9BILA